MTSTTLSTTRRPATVVTATALTTLLALVGGYGAIFFTGLDGWDAAGITFVTTYDAIALFGLVSAWAMFLGNAHGRVGVAAYAIFMIGFTVMKVLTIQELQAIPFGVVALGVLAAALHPRSRAYTG
ncbi:hypothetical protein [Nocardioides iriomotensis]|uniref:DUF4345 domain-containing protein n=1 Tax=Nocardioides iriomotensis TaxID=715784 RepID=A0A4Q5J655_9ACTN|nr:hypothetical protein [Nocardioides iriomotensis]RYU14117.1 hypothetical protein ETU37_04205 [Nocardioides iriomotensis]